MVENQNTNKKKHTISEENTLPIIERYSAFTVLGMLAEIAENPGEKLDWHELVNKTSTGISNAREYQMLWRHLAYGDELLDKVEDGAQPLDDDSDLECEVEAYPNVSGEATTEAAAYVKILAASSQIKSTAPSSSIVEAPLMINVPTARSDSESSQSMGSKYITVPVYVHKQKTSTEGLLDSKGPASCAMTAQRKRKLWSTEEDEALKAVVKKYGEGNWTTIIKEGLMEGRTASQLSQKWSILKKKDTNLEIVGHEPQLSEAQSAARHAMSVAINGPKSFKETGTSKPVSTNVNSSVGNTITAVKASSTSISTSQGRNPTDKGQLGSAQVVAKKPSEKPNFIPESTVRATAVAAGARIATPSDAALLLKAAQSKNAVHIKSSLSRATPALNKVTPGALRPGLVKIAPITVKPLPPALPKSSVTNPTKTSQEDKAVLPNPGAETSKQVDAAKLKPPT